MEEARSSVRLVLRMAAIATFLIGLATLLKPDTIIAWFDGSAGESNHMVRFIGTALIGFATANWLYSNSEDVVTVLPAIYGNLVSLGLAIAVDLVGLLQHKLARPAWLILALHAAFMLGFTYCIVLICRVRKTGV